MDIQREERMKSYFVVPQLSLIIEFTQIRFLKCIYFSSYRLWSVGSFSFRLAEHLSFNVSIGTGWVGGDREKGKESGAENC